MDTLLQVTEVGDCVLPIDLGDGLCLDVARAREIGEALAGDYVFAEPYPHIVLDNFLPDALLRQVQSRFPAGELPSDRVFELGYAGQFKRQIFPEDCDGSVRALFNFFNSAPFLQFLEGLTTIQGLLADPYFEGAGFHETRSGGSLGVHADFRINPRLKLHRRLNVIIYLNDRWHDAWNGHLEIWDRKMTHCARKIAPLFNRCVVFNTEADTFHGHPDPLATPPDVLRRSIALYYYTASNAVYEEVPDRGTLYAPRPGEKGLARREALSLRRHEILRDWVPPIVLRFAARGMRGARKLTGIVRKN